MARLIPARPKQTNKAVAPLSGTLLPVVVELDEKLQVNPPFEDSLVIAQVPVVSVICGLLEVKFPFPPTVVNNTGPNGIVTPEIVVVVKV
jgi:hypothetical protein